MYRDRAITVVIPCHNVATHVGAVIESVPAWVDRVVAVEDGSRDGTYETLMPFARGRVLVLRHERNEGMGAAMLTGTEEAFRGGADVVVKMDGDGQMDPQQIARLLDGVLADDVMYAKGNRLLDRPALEAMPRVRLLGNFLLSFMAKLASGYWQVLDPVNGFTALRREAWDGIDRERIHPGYFFQVDMLVELNVINARVRDVPMPARYGSERSSLRLRREIPMFARLLLDRVAHRFWSKYVVRDFSPIALFVFAGLVLFVWGLVFGIWAWWDHARQGMTTPTGTVMVSVLPLLMGFQLLLQALVLDIQQAPR